MSRRATKQVTTSPALKPIVKALRACVGARRAVEVFDDFVAMLAIAMRNASEPRAFDPAGWDAREEQYLRIVGRYEPQQVERFAEAAAHLTLGMESEPRDLLGRLYMELGAGDSGLGQFFTPDTVARLLAEMHLPDMLNLLERQDHVTVYEPACGGGAMLIALVLALRERGVDVTQRVHIVAEDLDLTAVHMTYVQLTLLHVPARVRHANSVSGEVFSTWPTLAHHLGGWDARLRHASGGSAHGSAGADAESPTNTASDAA